MFMQINPPQNLTSDQSEKFVTATLEAYAKVIDLLMTERFELEQSGIEFSDLPQLDADTDDKKLNR